MTGLRQVGLDAPLRVKVHGVVLTTQGITIITAAGVEQNSKAIELTKGFVVPMALPFIMQIIVVATAVITEHTKAVGVARPLR